MRKTAISFIAAAGTIVLLAPAAPASAHHAFSAEFDANRPLQLTGTVSRTEWINPHSWIPNGTELVIDGFGAKDGSNTANARDITFPDGSRFFVGSSGTGAPYERNR